MWITATVEGAGHARQEIVLLDGQVKHVDFELQSSALHIDVVDADGRAAPDVWVQVLRTDDGSNEVVAAGSTGADGRLELSLVQAGKFDAHAYEESLGEGRVQLEIGANQRAHELRIALERGVAFAGDVECRGTKLDIDHAPKLLLRQDGAPSEPIWIDLKLEGGVFRFSRSGIRAGRYSVVCDDGVIPVTQVSRPVKFELGPQGNGAMHLVFDFGS
jgi:5-hydroxyisourate hydrolase-like protein (transthyretin family)